MAGAQPKNDAITQCVKLDTAEKFFGFAAVQRRPLGVEQTRSECCFRTAGPSASVAAAYGKFQALTARSVATGNACFGKSYEGDFQGGYPWSVE